MKLKGFVLKDKLASTWSAPTWYPNEGTAIRQVQDSISDGAIPHVEDQELWFIGWFEDGNLELPKDGKQFVLHCSSLAIDSSEG